MEAFCILAAGRGERLQKVMNLHKCLAPIDNKAVISHIIEKAPINIEIIVAIGHQGQIVKEYCEAAHPDRKFTFVKVDNYDGPGSGPGHSLSCCKHYLQRPFYLFCGDCIVEEPLPDLSSNWMGVSFITDPEHWSTAQIYEGKVVNFKNKSPDGYEFAFIGVAGIKDYDIFWTQIKNTDQEFEMVSAFYNPLAYSEINAIYFTWHDTGTPENYTKSKETLGFNNLSITKEINEFTYKVNDRCVKIFGDSTIAYGRIKRAKLLHGLVPCLVYRGEHVYSYHWINGITMYDKILSCDNDIIINFLDWCDYWLWIKMPNSQEIMPEQCNKFYKDKTYERLKLYLNKKTKQSDTEHIINGRLCQPIESYLKSLNWNILIENSVPGAFHGDLQFENVIVDENDNFSLIDWRDCFGDYCSFGDIYYDLAKLYSGLTMCYDSIKQHRYGINVGNTVSYWFETPEKLNIVKILYENWLLRKGFDLYKVRLLTALIYLNMAPLHTNDFDDLLFYHSKYLFSLL